MTAMLDLGPAARQVALLLEGITDDQLPAPTPCDCTVRDLLAHLLGLTVAFRDAARKDLGPATRTDPGSSDAAAAPLDEDWRRRLPRLLDELTAAWRSPGAWEGVTQAGGVTLPAAEAGRVALNELVLHGWDLARGTGQDYTCDEASLRASIALLSRSTDEADRAGTYGPVVEVPDGAPLLDRAVGLGGRRPSWTPDQAPRLS